MQMTLTLWMKFIWLILGYGIYSWENGSLWWRDVCSINVFISTWKDVKVMGLEEVWAIRVILIYFRNEMWVGEKLWKIDLTSFFFILSAKQAIVTKLDYWSKGAWHYRERVSIFRKKISPTLYLFYFTYLMCIKSQEDGWK